MRRTIRQSIRDAVETEDARLAGAVADKLREAGYDYQATFEAFERAVPGIERRDFEQLLYEADGLS